MSLMMAYLAPSKRSWLIKGASPDPQSVLASLIWQAGLRTCSFNERAAEKKSDTLIFKPADITCTPARRVQAVTMAAPFKVYLKSNVNTYLMLLVWPDQTVRDMAGEGVAA